MDQPAPRPKRSDQEAQVEAALMRGVAQGNKDAIAKFYDQYASLVLRMTVNRQQQASPQIDRENATQEIFVQLYRAAKTYDPQIPLNAVVIKTTLCYLRTTYPNPEIDAAERSRVMPSNKTAIANLNGGSAVLKNRGKSSQKSPGFWKRICDLVSREIKF